jgi:hypothetical protein
MPPPAPTQPQLGQQINLNVPPPAISQTIPPVPVPQPQHSPLGLPPSGQVFETKKEIDKENEQRQ